MRMRQNYIFWNNMDIISLHKTMYTSFEQKKNTMARYEKFNQNL